MTKMALLLSTILISHGYLSGTVGLRVASMGVSTKRTNCIEEHFLRLPQFIKENNNILKGKYGAGIKEADFGGYSTN